MKLHRLPSTFQLRARDFARDLSTSIASAPKLHRGLLSLVAAIVVVVGAAGCEDKLADKVMIEKQLRAGAKAIEDNKISDAADVLADHYKDKGKRDKITLKRMAMLLRRRGPVGLFLRDVDITLDGIDDQVAREGNAPDGSTAQVKMNVFAVQGSKSPKTAADLIPTGARKHEIAIQMQKVDGEWLVTAMHGDRMNVGG